MSIIYAQPISCGVWSHMTSHLAESHYRENDKSLAHVSGFKAFTTRLTVVEKPWIQADVLKC